MLSAAPPPAASPRPCGSKEAFIIMLPRVVRAARCAGSVVPAPRLFSAVSESVDFYRVLGVPRDADAAAIKAGFHAAALRYHPDVRGESGAELFKRVNEAYTVLSDPGASRRRAPARARGAQRVAPRHRRPQRARAHPLTAAHAPHLLPPAESRRAYDANRYDPDARPAASSAAPKGGPSTRERNEGVFGGVGPVDAAADDAFRAAMARSVARVKDGARARASLSRLHRAQVDIPPEGTVSFKAALPLVALAIWGVNWLVFMR